MFYASTTCISPRQCRSSPGTPCSPGHTCECYVPHDPQFCTSSADCFPGDRCYRIVDYEPVKQRCLTCNHLRAILYNLSGLVTVDGDTTCFTTSSSGGGHHNSHNTAGSNPSSTPLPQHQMPKTTPTVMVTVRPVAISASPSPSHGDGGNEQPSVEGSSRDIQRSPLRTGTVIGFIFGLVIVCDL